LQHISNALKPIAAAAMPAAPSGHEVTENDHAQSARHSAFLAAATSDNTRRAYRSAVKHFLAWGGMLPASEQDIVKYLLAYADSLNPRTLSLRITALSCWHEHQGFVCPAGTPTVRKTLAGIARTNGKPKTKARALPVEDLARIVALLDELATLNAARDSALLQIGFYAGLRRSELVGIDVDDIAWEKEGVTITLPRSKTDQSGEGVMKSIPYGDNAPCPASALSAWLAAAAITAGPVFRPISRWGKIAATRMHPSSVNTILAAIQDSRPRQPPRRPG
jgi:integrase